MGELSKDNLLRSWKEIAAYLGVDIRTCCRWENERGLPVHRAEDGEKKSPVFAYKNELDAWFKHAFKSTRHLEELRRTRRLLRWIVGVPSLVVLSGILLYLLALRTPRQPADFEIQGSVFVALDEHKRELWRRDTRVEDLQTEGYYRSNFQVIHTDQVNILPLLVMKDIDGDGGTEVLLAVKRLRDQTGEGYLYCFDRRGKKRWEFKAGEGLVCGGYRFAPDFRIAGLLARDVNGDGRAEIFVEAFNSPSWPCLLITLDSSGEKTGEFVNAGYLREIAFHDINGDGREELLAAGVNNEYRGGCLAVFDPLDIRGGSPQTGEFKCEKLEPGSMLYYVTLPFCDVSRAQGHIIDGLRTLEITGGDWIRAETSNGIYYDFDFNLKCFQVGFGHAFMMDHYEMWRAGAVTSLLDDAYKAELIKGVRYWDGSAWASAPTPVKR